MDIDLDTFSISSVAYSTAITDRRLYEKVKDKDKPYVKLQSSHYQSSVRNKTSTESIRRRSSERNSHDFGEAESLWKDNEKYDDTSRNYRQPYRHLGLWSRINRNSGGSLPKEIISLSGSEIIANDRATVESYTTPSRGIRKCCLTVFTACAEHAARSLGFFENCKKRPYSCKPIASAVLELSKNTHAGTDTLGRKNDEKVQKRVVKQVRDIFRKPTSYRVVKKNPSLFYDRKLENLLNLPELIFHRFQATYDEIKDICTEKSRVVWCVPYTIVSIENVFFGNIIEATKKHALLKEEVIYPIGLTNFQIGQRSVKTLRNKFKIVGNKNMKIYSLDFKKFDSNIVSWAKDLFFALCNAIIVLDFLQNKVYNFLRFYIKYTPFVYEGEVKYKLRGISSGLLITNLFDSWFNLVIHYFVKILLELFPENVDEIYSENTTFDRLFMDRNKVKTKSFITCPWVRVMGDDSIILCNEYTLILHQKVCKMLGMTVTVKHITNSPYDPIFFLGRYWDVNNRPYQSEEYMALRICYTKWYDEKEIPFHRQELHLNRMLSICLPLLGGKEFLDKYLFDYEPYREFKNSKKGFVYMKDFIENNFRFTDYSKAFIVDSY